MTDQPDTIKKTDEAQAEFNNSWAFLEMVSQLEKGLEAKLMTWELQDAFYILESYENCLAFCFKGEEQEEINKKKAEIQDWFNKYPNMGQTFTGYDGKKHILHATITPFVRSKLIELNKYLREIKYKRGMGMPKKGEGKLF